MADHQVTALTGEVLVTLVFKELRAVQNPEPIGKAEWDLRLWINGIERWGTDRHLSVAQGAAVPIDARVSTKVAAFTDQLVLALQGIERDVNPDDHAAGELTLYRAHGFRPPQGAALPLAGRSANVEVLFDVEVELA